MKTRKFHSLALALGLVTPLGLAACGGDDEPASPDASVDPSPDAAPGPDAEPGAQTIRVIDDITADTTWESQNTYVLPRLKQVFIQPGATLTIEPGTVVKGEQGSLLVVTRGARIVADGTAADPIVFTSAQPEAERTRGFWGGLLVLGAAPINNSVNSTPPSTEATFEAFTSAIPEGKFGGTEPNDDSGVLRYVRIEFGGFNFVSDREFNNLTLAGVGKGTVIDFVQVHAGNDDGIEFFGGTVDVKHLLSTQNGDDGFDTDNGWSGRAQFVVIQNVNPDGAREASNGYESDNHGTAASYEAAPRTLPTVYNVTVIGNAAYTGGTSFAAVLRRGTGGQYFNHIFTGFPQGLEARDTATATQITAGNLDIKNSIFFGNDAAGDVDNWPAPQATGDIDEEGNWGPAAETTNREVDPKLAAAATSLTAPSFLLQADSPALTGGATPPSDGFFDTAATYVGAFDATNDWTAGWTAYPQPGVPAAR